MIECSRENIWYTRKNKKRKKRFSRLFIFLLIVTGIFLYGRFVVAVNLSRICSDYAYSYTTESVGDAILYSLTDSIKYADLIKIEKDNNGQITLMTTNSYKVNFINREVVKHTEIYLENKLNKGIPIPFMAFTGLEIISGIGKPINFNALSIVSVESNFTSKFQSVGINQTLHSVFVSVKCKVKIHIPLYTEVKDISTEILISEAVLIGKVPEVYLNGALFN